MSNSMAGQAATQEPKFVHNAVIAKDTRQATMMLFHVLVENPMRYCVIVSNKMLPSHSKLLPVTQCNFKQSLISCLAVWGAGPAALHQSSWLGSTGAKQSQLMLSTGEVYSELYDNLLRAACYSL
jgi:hypothetical protein